MYSKLYGKGVLLMDCGFYEQICPSIVDGSFSYELCDKGINIVMLYRKAFVLRGEPTNQDAVTDSSVR